MNRRFECYIGGKWIATSGGRTIKTVNPASGAESGEVYLAGAAEVDRAVQAARGAFEAYSHSSKQDRAALLGRILVEYERRLGDVAAAITADIGSPTWLSQSAQAPAGIAHIKVGVEALASYSFAELAGTTRVEKVPIGVCGLITPWNWPLNQIACKVVPALATGCTMVLKPSEIAPAAAQIWAEILGAAGVPAGVFNLVTGNGTTGAALSAHPGVDMISITGSTRAGIEVARAAAPTVKRVCQELGGKSANIVLDDVDVERVFPAALQAVLVNSGQSCNAPTRLLVPQEKMPAAAEAARAAAAQLKAGPPESGAFLGPVASQAQWQKIQSLIRAGIGEGAALVTGGPGNPDGLSDGYYVRPTVFASVRNDMRIAREEIFGPVLVIIGYRDEEDAIRIANETAYGLAGYVQGADRARALRVAQRLRVGQVALNGAPYDFAAPFGGFKQSGNGREWGAHGFSDYLELRAILGAEAPSSAAA